MGPSFPPVSLDPSPGEAGHPGGSLSTHQAHQSLRPALAWDLGVVHGTPRPQDLGAARHWGTPRKLGLFLLGFEGFFFKSKLGVPLPGSGLAAPGKALVGNWDPAQRAEGETQEEVLVTLWSGF